MSLSWILLLTCMAQALLVIIWILRSMNCAWKYRQTGLQARFQGPKEQVISAETAISSS
jgi:hypothetical protein